MAKTKKDLAKYLADYLKQELDTKKEEYDFDTAVDFFVDNLSDYIEQGLEAFESTENVIVIFLSPEENCLLED